MSRQRLLVAGPLFQGFGTELLHADGEGRQKNYKSRLFRS